MYDVAIILINYNTANYTLDCIKTIEDKTSNSLSYQVIVIDNNSELDDYSILQQYFPQKSNFKLHRSPINTGFGGGNMLGTQFANASYLAFLNNDAILLNDAMSLLKRYMDENLEAGVCTAQNYNESDEPVPSFDHHKDFWRLLLGRSYLEKSNPKKYPKQKAQYQDPLVVNWVNGCFLFFRSTAFSEIGGFDTNIFLYFEEMDLCKRLENKNWSAVLVPEAKILHYQSKSSGYSVRINKEAFLSHLYVIKKHYSVMHYRAVQIFYLVTLLFKPKKSYLWPVAWKGANLSHSIKHEQTLRWLNEEN